MASIKALQEKLSKLEKERDDIGKAYSDIGRKWSKACDSARIVERQIKEARKKPIKNVKIGEWYNYNLNKDIFFKVAKIGEELVWVYQTNTSTLPRIDLTEMSKENFSCYCNKAKPPVDKIMDKIRSFLNE